MGSSEPTLVKMPRCWKSPVVVHIHFFKSQAYCAPAWRRTQHTSDGYFPLPAKIKYRIKCVRA